MKVAILSEGRYPVYGGGQVHVEYLCKYLTEDFGATVDLFTRALKQDGIYYTADEKPLTKRTIYRVGIAGHYFNKIYRILYLGSCTWSLFRHARKKRYDIIHAHALLAGIPAYIVGFLLRIPVVYTVHGSIHLDSGIKNIYYYIEKFLITKMRYAAEIFVSHQTLAYTNNNKEISVIHNGVDIEKFTEEIHIPDKTGFTMLTVGRVDWQKNHIAVIYALSRIEKTILDKINFTWEVVGDGPLLEQCKNIVAECGLEKYIVFTGPIFGKSLVRKYRLADIFILPSLAEGQPLTILEALASALPVIATDVGDNTYIIKNTINGLLIPVDDIDAIENAIRYCIDVQHREILVLWGKTGYDFVVEKYNRHAIIEKTYRLYKTILHEK